MDIPIQCYYLSHLVEINAIFGQQQIENIIKTMCLIEQNPLKREYQIQSKNSNIQKCIQWCLKHNIPYNKNLCPKNIFLSDSNQ